MSAALKHTDDRNRYYKLLAVANRHLKELRPGFTDDDYRHILFMNGASEKNGKFSATTMTIEQLEAALDQCRSLGFKARFVPKKHGKASSPGWRNPRIGKLMALWNSLANAGVVNDRSRKAMERYCMNHVPGLERFEWISSAQLNTAIETLKKAHQQRGLDSYKTNLIDQ
ncbi:MAG: hypothetical protein C9356_12400 [Oleiphilus sp.]|nr:MAG: hypothetical protein C9356_12400 [Oleiphilus sp.]